MSDCHYTYRVTWSDEDGEWVGLCAEFPSLSHLDASPAKALFGICRLVEDVVADMEAAGEPIPEPLSTKKFSGKFMARVPPELHRSLAIEAAEAHVSINRIVNLRLAAAGPVLPALTLTAAPPAPAATAKHPAAKDEHPRKGRQTERA